MKRLLAVLMLVLVAAAASAQPNLSYQCSRDNTGKLVTCSGLRPVVTAEMGIPPGTPFYDTSTFSMYYWSGTAWTASNAAGATLTSQLLLPTGTSAAPSLSAAAEPRMGFYFDTGSFLTYYAVAGTNYLMLGSTGLGINANSWLWWSSGQPGVAAPDLYLKRGAANVLLQENANSPQASRISGGFSGYVETGSVTEAITLDTGATTTDSTANLLPANSIIDFVTYRVTTTITTAVNFSIGDATTPARFVSGATGMVAGSTGVGIIQNHPDVAAAAGPVQISAAKVRITTNANPGAGVIRVQVFYRTAGVPST